MTSSVKKDKSRRRRPAPLQQKQVNNNINRVIFPPHNNDDVFEDREQEEVATTPRDLVQNCYDKTDAALKAYHLLTENMEDPALLFQMLLSAKDNSAQEDIGELVRHDDPETLEELLSSLDQEEFEQTHQDVANALDESLSFISDFRNQAVPGP